MISNHELGMIQNVDCVLRNSLLLLIAGSFIVRVSLEVYGRQLTYFLGNRAKMLHVLHYPIVMIIKSCEVLITLCVRGVRTSAL